MAERYSLSALKREAEREPFPFEFGGEDFELPGEVDQVVGMMLAEADRDPSQAAPAFRKLVGEGQWNRLVALPDILTMEMLQALMAAYGEHLGVPTGESQASPPSSNRAARRSKPTSKPRTISA